MQNEAGSKEIVVGSEVRNDARVRIAQFAIAAAKW